MNNKKTVSKITKFGNATKWLFLSFVILFFLLFIIRRVDFSVNSNSRGTTDLEYQVLYLRDEVESLESRIDELESENKDLRENLELLVKCIYDSAGDYFSYLGENLFYCSGKIKRSL